MRIKPIKIKITQKSLDSIISESPELEYTTHRISARLFLARVWAHIFPDYAFLIRTKSGRKKLHETRETRNTRTAAMLISILWKANQAPKLSAAIRTTSTSSPCTSCYTLTSICKIFLSVRGYEKCLGVRFCQKLAICHRNWRHLPVIGRIYELNLSSFNSVHISVID